MDDPAAFSFVPPSAAPPPSSTPPPRAPEHPAPSPEAPDPSASSSSAAHEDRQCRICFEAVPYPYPPSPDLGRLISPCTCAGSSRYVHSGCLQQWRSTSRQAYYQCPTCHYRYRLRRLTVSSFLTSTGLKLFLSLLILVLITWVLGFMSEPFLSGYLVSIDELLDPDLYVEEPNSWTAHFLRGLASLGIIGFMKVIYLLGPGTWWNVRTVGRWGGRDRAARLGWIVVAIGVLNFFVWLFKFVGSFVERRMAQAAADVMEVGEVDEEGRTTVKDEFMGMALGAWTKIQRWKQLVADFFSTQEPVRPHLD